ncbi:uncharacterized protein EI97DRAFT_438214 [Westerdykella ornata]|uniref:CFEM domain-containing protein n=1 Tax=Westerdykella ornata TaxID=318751 RepID=A0A6A6JY53_WESOR|nr:uncharacterized protein EI97DRAFT_438214 [Westerdykella ornata]KAF2280768.1 hypothetical protein EI97DRAFT_438214 [Westerdykella ornata]
MRHLYPPLYSLTTTSFIQLFCLLATVRHTSAIPHSSGTLLRVTRQSSFESLALPTCALTCFITTLTTDGCDNETDFQCHCRGGRALASAQNCLNTGCGETDRKEATDKVGFACRAVGMDMGNTGSNEDRSSASSSPTLQVTTSTTQSQAAPSTASVTITSTSSPSSLTTSAIPSTTSIPNPTNMPFAPRPSNRQLSAGAKAGITLSITLFFSLLFVSTTLYIRRLKRQLLAAQAAAAGVPEDVWRAHISTAAGLPGTMGRQADRRGSWGSWGRGRSTSMPTSPVSPLDSSAGFGYGGGEMRETSQGSMAGVFQGKKNRGQVLSVVVERVEEEESSGGSIREPVPGQREGLVDPLELDGEGTGIVELPVSVTPRARSRERR